MKPLFEIRTVTIGVDECIAAVVHPGAGGISVFIGTVRQQNDGHTVSLLEYEAYISMAEKEMTAIGEDLVKEFPGVRVAALHRIGRLGVGDVAVVCAASAPHREEAFRACRELIDRIKQRVPIWKREHGPDGAQWVGWQSDDVERTPP
jgi:molybdopterin synthase catalytic subunit